MNICLLVNVMKFEKNQELMTLVTKSSLRVEGRNCKKKKNSFYLIFNVLKNFSAWLSTLVFR